MRAVCLLVFFCLILWWWSLLTSFVFFFFSLALFRESYVPQRHVLYQCRVERGAPLLRFAAW
jgi:hypothetical protein